MEILGDAVDRTPGAPRAVVGIGTHPFRDPRMVDDFAAPRLDLDVAGFHTYAVDRRPDHADLLVDGEVVRPVHVTPDDPMQTMLAVFDLPERAVAGEPYVVPELVVDAIRGEPPA